MFGALLLPGSAAATGQAKDVYELKGFGCHTGTPRGGHCYTVTYSARDKTWLLCNCSKVSVVAEADVLSTHAKLAYVVAYERRA